MPSAATGVVQVPVLGWQTPAPWQASAAPQVTAWQRQASPMPLPTLSS